jgi:hypothetical protein
VTDNIVLHDGLKYPAYSYGDIVSVQLYGDDSDYFVYAGAPESLHWEFRGPNNTPLFDCDITKYRIKPGAVPNRKIIRPTYLGPDPSWRPKRPTGKRALDL